MSSVRSGLAAVGFCLLGLAGCASNDHAQCAKLGLPRLIVLNEVGQVFDALANGFCPASCSGAAAASGTGACDEQGLSRLVLVPDFVNLTTYSPGSTGLYMGEQMRAALSQRCSSKIYQAEFGRDLKLSGEGLVALTRDPAEVVKDEFVGQDILIGTYSYSGNRLSVFVRKISGASGVISKMLSKEIEFSCGNLGTRATVVR